MFGRARQLQTRVDQLAREVRVLEDLVARLAHRAGAGAAELAQLRGQTQPGITPEIRSLVVQGKHIPAIKAYREATGAGLKEAKDAIDALRDGRT
ncbi:ribosomal protein L7/L12 [Ornithinimicrobium sufpigmenti]|uniref:ribosomal protein L7/L12 n=1 Tax=Ornithinimicrobium sufpigmenti TaxID=2508882 RepID=UPI0010367664|nr:MULTISPECIES: ribosomal protein L7/L12 [unclassified Ornithinimicrobium]